MKINPTLRPADLEPKISSLWRFAAQKIQSLEKSWNPSDGAPVFTVDGKYTARGWTEWTQGFQFGMPLLLFDATGGKKFLESGRSATITRMAPHLTHVGVHDHGFNNVSTYGNLWRLMNEGRIPENEWERNFYELALKCSGAVQARRWTPLPDGGGFIYSFNGPHSLFVDTIRSLRALALAHKLGHVLQEENDRRVSLLARLKAHAKATAEFSVYYGGGRDAYDIRGRTTHEAVFNTNDGAFRCPNSQQGYSPFSTWTRGLAWAMCGFAEQLEFTQSIGDAELRSVMLKAAIATCDFYIDHATASDGIPYWDTGAPDLHKLGDWQSRPAEPFNDHEPVDSSAAAIAAQGLMRLGRILSSKFQVPNSKSKKNRNSGTWNPELGTKYRQAGLTVMNTLLDEPYLSTTAGHQGLLLHSVYHRPRGWDFVPKGRKVPCGESSMWGDYHMMEAALLVQRLARKEKHLTFF